MRIFVLALMGILLAGEIILASVLVTQITAVGIALDYVIQLSGQHLNRK